MKIFFSASSAYEVRLLKQKGISNVLISYFLWKGVTKKSLSELKGLNVMLDSGAYSAYNSGAGIDTEDYISFIKENKSLFDSYVVLDVIGDQIETIINQKIMEKSGLKPIPVFHIQDDFKYLEILYKKHEVIGLGGCVGKRPTLIEKWLENILTRYPNQKFHLFGTTRKRFLKFPLHSVDSTSWYTNFDDRLNGETNQEAILRRISKIKDREKIKHNFQQVII